MKTAIVILAIGEKKWGELALNLALSIKANSPEQKIALIYEHTAIAGIEPLIEKHIDYGMAVTRYDTAIEFSFFLKTRLYDMATEMCDAEAFIYLDADTIIVPGKKPFDWFVEHKDRIFTSYCNDIINLETGKRRRKDYTFWCEPMDAALYFNLKGKMPQVNSSFLYFVRDMRVKELFDKAKEVYDDNKFPYEEYKGAKPDELCFNIACCHTGLLPHRDTYRPVFFQFGSETHTRSYIHQYFASFGFAGVNEPSKYLLDTYHETAEHYRWLFGIADEFKLEFKPDISIDYLPIEILSRRTLYRKGELPNSNGGVFNPSAFTNDDGCIIATIYRKEAGIAKNMYVGTTALPHLETANFSRELQIISPPKLRFEDFRLFEHEGELYASHTVCENINTSNVEASCGISKVNTTNILFKGKVQLPITTSKVEKNWVFFSQLEYVYCVYSVSPYRLFRSLDMVNWEEVKVEQPELKWIDKGFISNSTNPVLVGDEYLMFFHTKSAGEYYHGALLIDANTKEITHATKKPIRIETGGEGIAPKLKYISGCAYLKNENKIRVFIGEGDSNAVYNDFDAETLIKTIKKYKI